MSAYMDYMNYLMKDTNAFY